MSINTLTYLLAYLLTYLKTSNQISYTREKVEERLRKINKAYSMLGIIKRHLKFKRFQLSVFF